mmetsp:Transcript_35295/g.72226  ORF Transcript_35295/g.72226 Transcript_35295/m.72226 type:complete len:125 (-) Transcript_35295:235-609(-)
MEALCFMKDTFMSVEATTACSVLVEPLRLTRARFALYFHVHPLTRFQVLGEQQSAKSGLKSWQEKLLTTLRRCGKVTNEDSAPLHALVGPNNHQQSTQQRHVLSETMDNHRHLSSVHCRSGKMP